MPADARAHRLPDKHHDRLRGNGFQASHKVGEDEISQVNEREAAVALAPLTSYRVFEVLSSLVPSITYTASGLRQQLRGERDRVAEPEPALQSDDVVVAIQLPGAETVVTIGGLPKSPRFCRAKLNAPNTLGDDDVDLPAGVLRCEIIREHSRLIGARKSLAFDGLLVELEGADVSARKALANAVSNLARRAPPTSEDS
jgi:hypothetical protein